MNLSVVAIVGYSVAGMMLLLLAALIMTNWRGRLKGGVLAATSFVSAIWAFAFAYDAYRVTFTAVQILLLEMSFDAAWLVFVAMLVSGAISDRRKWWIRFFGVGLVAVLVILGVGFDIAGHGTSNGYDSTTVLIIGSILTALVALVSIEQVYRNARPNQKHNLKYLCLGVGAIFAYDLFLYSNAILVGRLSEVFWVARGVVVAMCVPLIGIAARRSPDWTVGMFVSRHVVFYTATVFGAGLYLTFVGVLGYYLRRVGGGWGQIAQIIFFAAGAIVLSIFLFSDRFRARLKVSISKHFFENRYDYREEWLRLIRTLTMPDDPLPLKKRAIRALANIVDSAGGQLWLYSETSKEYVCVAGWNMGTSNATIAETAPLPTFLSETGWVIEENELIANAGRYRGLVREELAHLDATAYVLPLLHERRLLGFVTLAPSTLTRELNYEDRDLLKTAGQQIASYLAQEIATMQLSENKQFETFNRLTAFLMHDLKNLIAQQSLVVENAEKHKSNPEFVDDAIATVKNSVTRLRRVVDQLRLGDKEQHLQNVELSKLLLQVVSQCGDRKPIPRLETPNEQVWVLANNYRLSMAVLHAVRNAQDSIMDEAGSVSVSLLASASECQIQIMDTGCGMDESFVRDRLFRPFDSTKGTHGMGMGAYQLREAILQFGGRVEVDSKPGVGTTLTLTLPLVRLSHE